MHFVPVSHTAEATPKKTRSQRRAPLLRERRARPGQGGREGPTVAMADPGCRAESLLVGSAFHDGLWAGRQGAAIRFGSECFTIAA